MTAHTPGSPTGAPRDDAQPTDGDGVDAGRRAEGGPGSWAARYARSFDISQGLASVDPEYAEWIDPVASVTLAARTIRELTAERDRARATAVTLETELNLWSWRGDPCCDYCDDFLEDVAAVWIPRHKHGCVIRGPWRMHAECAVKQKQADA